MSTTFYVATRKGLFRVSRKAKEASWRITHTAFLGDNVSVILPDPRDGRLYAALDHGHFGVKIHRSKDDGESWEECSAPAYPPKPEGEVSVCPQSGIQIPWTLKLVWALEAGGKDQPGTLWCGTLPGGLFRSTDRGSSWQLNEALWYEPQRKRWFGGGRDFPGIHSICVDPGDSKHVTVAVSCGGVWKTTDGGASWVCSATGMRAEYMPPEQAGDPVIQDPHRMVQCPAAPDHLWVQHHNGVFRSTNGATSWQEIKTVKPSVFGFAVAVHPNDPKTAWTVPALKDEKRIPVDGKVVVARTRDGGESFEVLRNGLPQEHAYDLTFRHALDVDETGDRLAFGTTTGAVWVSENGGDRWECVSAHLPPVHALRFVKPA